MPRRPLDVLEESIGDSVSVLLKDDTVYVGTLAGFDQHLNVVLEDAASESDDSSEVDADSDADTPAGESAEPGEDTIVIRGDNVVSIRP